MNPTASVHVGERQSLWAAFRNWFSHLPVGWKLALVTLFFVLPDAVMLRFYLKEINEQLSFASLERIGIEMQKPIEDLLRDIPEFGLNLETAGAVEPHAVLRREIDEAFQHLAIETGKMSAELKSDPAGGAKRDRQEAILGEMRAEWENLKKSDDAGGVANIALQRQSVKLLQEMMNHVGEIFDLNIDRNLDSSYLADITVRALPTAETRAAEVIILGERIAADNITQPAERDSLIEIKAQVELDALSTSTILRAALVDEYSPNGSNLRLRDSLALALTNYNASAAGFFAQLESMIQATGAPDQSGLVAKGRVYRNACVSLWAVATQSLIDLLDQRIRGLERQRRLSLSVAASALAGAIGFITFITTSIANPLRLQAASLAAANDRLHAEISERKRTEEDLRRSERQLALAQEISLTGSWEWNRRDDRVAWSSENYRIYGVEPSKSIPPTFRLMTDAVHDDDRGRFVSSIESAVKTGDPFAFEHRIVRPDGTEIVVQQRGNIIEDGESIKVVGATQDITARKRSEEELERIHSQLLDASRQAGMAEVATGVLHNVGNVLNSVNVAAQLISDSMNKSKVVQVSRMAQILRDHEGDMVDFMVNHRQGKQFPSFLAQLGEYLETSHKATLQEIQGLQKNIEHIKDIVAMQQTYAKVSGVREAVKMADLVEDALRLNLEGLNRSGITIQRDFDAPRNIGAEKHKVLQILVNLIRNARRACDDSKKEDKRLGLRIQHGNHSVRVSVIDNGVGIPPENLTRIFNHGFTTRKDGHGFGLHSGALAAKDLGGSLRAASEGPGKGAAFILDIPIYVPAG